MNRVTAQQKITNQKTKTNKQKLGDAKPVCCIQHSHHNLQPVGKANRQRNQNGMCKFGGERDTFKMWQVVKQQATVCCSFS